MAAKIRDANPTLIQSIEGRDKHSGDIDRPLSEQIKEI